MSRWNESLLTWVPPVLLVLVAIHQIYLAHAVELSAWKGGGFGMFSSTQLGPARYVRIYVQAPQRSEEMQVPQSLEDLAYRAAILPADGPLRNLSKGVVLREQRKERPVSEVKIEVWRTEYDIQSLAPQDKKIRDYVFKVE